MTKLMRASQAGLLSLGLMSCQAAPPATTASTTAEASVTQIAAPAAPVAETPVPQPVAATAPAHPGEAVY